MRIQWGNQTGSRSWKIERLIKITKAHFYCTGRMIETVHLNMEFYTLGKDCIKHTTSNITSGKAVGSEGVAKGITVSGKCPKSGVGQVLRVHIKMLAHYGLCHVSAQFINSGSLRVFFTNINYWTISHLFENEFKDCQKHTTKLMCFKQNFFK